MPFDFGVTEMVQAEYQRFIQGIEDLTDGGARNARAAAARVRRGASTVRTISVPAWDDVIHLQPRPIITPEMRSAHYEAKRAGKPSPLGDELVGEIERRGRRAASMASSTTPEYAKAYGQVMTALDNVQDLLTTVTTLGRFALSGSARLLDILRPVAFASAADLAALEATEAATFLARGAAASRLGLGLGARTIGRIVPILGPILIAADILKLITWLGLTMFPAYALVCQGLPAALAAGVLPAAQALAGKRAGKQRVGQLGKMNPWSMTARLDRGRTLRSWKPSIYNLMEVAQTTDQLFGVGVSFGGLVGLVSEAAFSTEAAARGASVRVDVSEFIRSLHLSMKPELARVPRQELSDLRTAASVLAQAPAVARVQDVFTFEEHVDHLVAVNAAWSLMRPWVDLPAMQEGINAGLDYWWAPPQPQHLETRAIVVAETGAFDGVGLWPLLGAPDRIQGQRFIETTAPEVTHGLAALVIPRADEPAAAFAAACAVQITDRSMIAATGRGDAFRVHWQPDWALLEGLALAGRVPVSSSDEGKLMDFWRRCLAEMERTGDQQLSSARYDQLADLAGIPLLRVA